MKVNVRYFNSLHEITGTTEEAVDLHEEATLKDALDLLSERHGKNFKEHAYAGLEGRPGTRLCFLVNGQNADLLTGLQTKLSPGAILSIFPHVGGG